MAGEEVKVEGADRLASGLRRLAVEMPKVAPPKAATIIGREAALRAPKRTGRLAASFGSRSVQGENVMTFGVVYAAAVHWGVGTRAGLRGPHNIRPTRFLWGAAQDLERQWLEAYEDRLQELVDDVKGA